MTTPLHERFEAEAKKIADAIYGESWGDGTPADLIAHALEKAFGEGYREYKGDLTTYTLAKAEGRREAIKEAVKVASSVHCPSWVREELCALIDGGKA